MKPLLLTHVVAVDHDVMIPRQRAQFADSFGSLRLEPLNALYIEAERIGIVACAAEPRQMKLREVVCPPKNRFHREKPSGIAQAVQERAGEFLDFRRLVQDHDRVGR